MRERIDLNDSERMACYRCALENLDPQDQDNIKALALEIVDRVKAINPKIMFSEGYALELLAAFGLKLAQRGGVVQR